MESFAFSKVSLPAMKVQQDRTASLENFVKNNITEAKKYSASFIALLKKSQKNYRNPIR